MTFQGCLQAPIAKGRRSSSLRITYIAAGAAGMYCGACARDVELVRGLMQRGHTVTLMPLYTPLKTDLPGTLPTTRLFYGGINVFLQQLTGLFRHTPRWLDRIFDHPRLLHSISRFALRTKPADLGPMTVSVLAGEHGAQQKELARLLDFFTANENETPELINITNSLLSGIAPVLKKHLGIPIVCNLQGEDDFVQSMPAADITQARDLMRQNAAAIDLYIAPTENYAKTMSEFLAIAPEKIRVVPIGLDTTLYKPAAAPTSGKSLTLGYLSVIIPRKGLDLLVDAWLHLVQKEGRDIDLAVAGKSLHPTYYAEIKQRIAAAGMQARFQESGEVDLAGKIAFMQRCDIFSVPSRFPESRGQAVLEALACGVPVVQPNTGAFLSMATRTGAVNLVERENASALAAAILRLIDSPAERAKQAAAARVGIERHFTSERMTRDIEAIYRELTAPSI